jgi:ABC-2 type transport system ATP-binding protein
MDIRSSIIIDKASKSFNGVRAIDNLTFGVGKGEIFGLIGPDGAGKTTLIRCIAGLLALDAGSITVEGIDVFKNPDQVKNIAGYMSQRFSLYTDLSVLENIRFFGDLYGIPRRRQLEMIPGLLHFARLEEYKNRRAEYLSGGMRQKLALVCTLINEPSVLLLDEPTTGVDPVSRLELWQIFRSIRDQGRTVFLSTPYMDEAERCDNIGFIHSGKLNALGTPDQMKSIVDGFIFEAIVSKSKAALELLRESHVFKDVQVFGERLHIISGEDKSESQVEETLKKIGVDVTAVRKTSPVIEDAFMQIVQETHEIWEDK